MTSLKADANLMLDAALQRAQCYVPVSDIHLPLVFDEDGNPVGRRSSGSKYLDALDGLDWKIRHIQSLRDALAVAWTKYCAASD